jgi:predicted PurR-regulated permease PerM
MHDSERQSSGALGLRWIQYFVYGSVILYFARSIFVPISFAALLSFVLYPVCAWFERKGVGRMTAILFALFALMMIGLLVFGLALFQMGSFIEEWPAIQSKLGGAIGELKTAAESLGISRAYQEEFIARLNAQSGGSIFSLIQTGISASAISIVILLLIPVYVVLILYYRRYWMKILSKLFPMERMESLREMISLTIQSYYNFIKGMAIVYIVVGALNSIGLLLLGVPHAILFGFIASILTFIPYVGIIAGSLLPMAMAWITYDSIWYPVGVAGIFAFVQYLEANVIFPVAVSNRLHVNTFVMLIAIFAGGLLWGVAGMILFVPFVGIAKLIADHNPSWKTISMILGSDNA